MLLSTAAFDQPEGDKFDKIQNVDIKIKIALIIFIFGLTVKTKGQFLFAKQIKTFIRKIKGEGCFSKFRAENCLTLCTITRKLKKTSRIDGMMECWNVGLAGLL